MFLHIVHLEQDDKFLQAISVRQVSKENCKLLPIWKELRSLSKDDLQKLELRLSNRGHLTFEVLFHETLASFFIKAYLNTQHSIDKATFVRDVAIYKLFRNLDLRRRALHKIYTIYCGPENPHRVQGVSVFEDESIAHFTESEISSSYTQIFEYSHQLPRISPTPSLLPTPRMSLLTPSNKTVSVSSSKRTISSSHDTYHTIDEIERINTHEMPQLFINKSNAIGVSGPPLQKLKERIDCGECDTNIFDHVLQQIIIDLKWDVFPRFIRSAHFEMYLRCKFIESKDINVSSFCLLRLLGRGAFGSVHACMKRDTGQLYAMKQLDKRRVQQTKSVQSLLAEKRFLQAMSSRFVTSLKYSFMDAAHIYLVMDLMSGGDLKYHLDRDSRFETKRARFYSAQVLLGLEHIHSKNIIMRDLKLDNLLVDEKGNVRISDLGLATFENNGHIHGYAGTPGYTAPEVILRQYYDKRVDFFSLGVVIHQMICGHKPFSADTAVKLDREIIESEPSFETWFSHKSKNLCAGLLQKNADLRLSKYLEIKAHPWFAGMDWTLLSVGYLKAPFIPTVNAVNAGHQNEIAEDECKYSEIVIKDELNESLKNIAHKSSVVIQSEVVQLLEQVSFHCQDIHEFAIDDEVVQTVQTQQCLPACVLL